MVNGFPAFPGGQNPDELEFWVLSVDEFVQSGSSPINSHTGQVMGAVKAALLQEERYKTWVSNLIERQDQRLKARVFKFQWET